MWAGMEGSLIAITSLLLRTHEAEKVGMIMYSILNFHVWLNIVDELFVMEPRSSLKPRWNKISEKLKRLKDTRDRLAHHTIHHQGAISVLGIDTSLRPGPFDTRRKSKKFKPLDFDQITEFTESVRVVVDEFAALLTSMRELLKRETLQKSSGQDPGENPS
jgi:hypothetical protein